MDREEARKAAETIFAEFCHDMMADDNDLIGGYLTDAVLRVVFEGIDPITWPLPDEGYSSYEAFRDVREEITACLDAGVRSGIKMAITRAAGREDIGAIRDAIQADNKQIAEAHAARLAAMTPEERADYDRRHAEFMAEMRQLAARMHGGE
jgi:hypothetical protein